MCGKDLLKMKVVSNKTGKVVSCNKLVQFKIAMERLNGIIEVHNAKETKNEKMTFRPRKRATLPRTFCGTFAQPAFVRHFSSSRNGVKNMNSLLKA
jgi:hypothetical protein